MTKLTKSMRWMAVAACTATIGLSALTGCGDKKMTADEKMEAMKGKPDIVDTATGPNMEDVTTVVTLIQKAGLVDTLKGPGPFTVFAPTNEAFGMVPKATMDMLSQPENKDKLQALLKYHVIAGQGLSAADFSTMTSPPTAEGKSIAVVKDGGTITLNGKAKVVKKDIICGNGVIHWIDHVLMPTDAPMPAMQGMNGMNGM